MSVGLARHFRNVIAWSCKHWSSPRGPSDRLGAMCDTGIDWNYGRRRTQPGSILSAVELAYVGQVVETEELENLTDTIAKLTWHSPRVTFLDAAVHHGAADRT